jgi:hypothetical protein
MLNIELARTIQADREREIEADVRSRRLLGIDRSMAVAKPADRSRPTIRQGQRPASSGAVSR